MSDDRNDPLGGLGDFDWDSALDEWEQKSFSPEVAKDAESATALPGEVAPGARPPTNTGATAVIPAGTAPTAPVSIIPTSDTATAIMPAIGAPTVAIPAIRDPEAEAPASDPALKAQPNSTVIAQVPRELRNDPPIPSARRASIPVPPQAPGTVSSIPPRASPPAPPPRSSIPPTRGGGLNQLFSRPPAAPNRASDPGAPPPGPPRPLPPAARPPSEKTRVAPAAYREANENVTRPIPVKDSPAAFDKKESPTKRKYESERTVVARPASGGSAPTTDKSLVGKKIDFDSADVAPATAPRPQPVDTTLVGGGPFAEGEPLPNLAGIEQTTAEHPAYRAAAESQRDDIATIASRSFAEALGNREDDDDNENDNATVVRDRIDPDAVLDRGNENATVVRDRGSLSDAETATRLPKEDAETATRLPEEDAPPPAALAPPPPVVPPEAPSRPAFVRPDVESRPAFDAERSRWLAPDKAQVFAARIDWLEEEARSVADPTAQARALLAVSELCAIVGERERALAIATDARDLDARLALTWRQARQLTPHDPDVLAEALDAEAAQSPTPSARAHAVLLSADLLRLNGRGDAAVERWESACKLDPADTRGPISRAALALAQDDHTSGSLRLADNSELVALDKAIATALRLRGVERPGAEVEDLLISDGLRHARVALTAGDVVTAAQSVGEIANLPELSKGAHWLSAALGSVHIASRRGAARALKTLVSEGDVLARRQLAARGIELSDPELLSAARANDSGGASGFEPSEEAVLGIFGSKEATELDPAAAAALAEDDAMAALVDALTSLSPAIVSADGADDVAEARAERVAGTDSARSLATLGRLLASNAKSSAIDGVLRASIADPRSAAAGGVAIETAVRGKRWDELSDALSSLPSSDGDSGAAQRHIAAALVAERAGNRDRAKQAWSDAAQNDAVATDGLLRIAATLDPEINLGAQLLRIGDTMPDGVPSAIVRLEGLARTSGLDDDEQSGILERVHRAAPTLGIGAFLAERVGRRKGDLDEVLRWLQERRSYATDPLETALDAVREALLIADRDPELASTRLEEAHRARPDDVALRELYERLAPEAPSDRGTWRETRATASASSLLWVEASLEHERTGDPTAALGAARKAAEAGDEGLSRALIERIELETGETTKQTGELIEVTKTSEDEVERREAFERLAQLDAYGKNDLGAALMWHRSILEGTPQHKPSLRWVEHALIGDGRDDELPGPLEQIALALDGIRGGETSAHAQHAARLRVRDAQANGLDVPGAWERTHDMARLAATQAEPSLWSLRALNAHARAQKDDPALLSTTLALLERTQRAPERAALLLRASEAAARLEKVAEARDYLEQAANEDPGDVVTWGLLADVRQRAGEMAGAAEACESLARTSVVREHQLLAWHDASKIWLDGVTLVDGRRGSAEGGPREVKDPAAKSTAIERAMSALEAAAEIDVTYADVFPRLSALYADRNLDAELARLLEKRLDSVEDEEERVALEVELSRAFAEMGELSKAKVCLESALEKRPDHTTALGAMAELCIKEGDWNGAEQAFVRLARLIVDTAEQRAIYERLGEIYSVHAPNLSRAEVAYKEVLKRAPSDRDVLAKLVDIYKRQGDVPRAVEAQQEIIAAETDPNARLASLIDLAKIHENIGRDPRRSEQVLDSARKEFPTSVVALRAMAEFYSRQRQMPAMQILLDRAAGDARRAFAQGRFVPSLFQVLHAAFELRGKRDAARVVAATLAAVEGEPSDLVGGEVRAVDPRFDDLLAPELMSPALRALLFRAGDALDVVAPVDLRALKAVPLQPGTPIGATVGSVATVVGLGALQILVSPVLDRVAIPLSTNPPTLLVGEGLAKVKNERARMFVVVRAMKMLLARASGMLRGKPDDVSNLVAGLFNAFNPSYVPQGMDAKKVAEVSRRIGPALPRNLDPTVGVIALEAAGMLGNQWSNLGPAAHGWANRVALLAVGDPNAALDALAWGLDEDAAPRGSEERAAWIARHPEARDLMTFSVTDAYAEARVQLQLER